MTFLPSCQELSRLMTDYLDGQLPLQKSIGVRLHLGLCPPCQAFAESFRALPALFRRALGQDEPPLGSAHAALEAALARASQPREPRLGPFCELPESLRTQLDSGRADRPLRTMAEVHRILLEEGPVAAAPHLPASLLAAFPPLSAWRWTSPGPGGVRFARLLEEGPSTLYVVRLGSEKTAPAHTHRGPEQALLLQGGLEDGPHYFGPGAWSLQAPGSGHAPHATAQGCWALVRVEVGVDFLGWRGWIQRASGS
jgi:anti-sigma factor ChrR (cupin superfamily)